MAKQIGELKITDTIDDITYYKMDGQYYARPKSSLSGKRVKTDPKFKRTMQSAHRLARGSQLASKVYRSLPRQEQVYALYKELKSIAIRALKEGKSEEAVLLLLQQRVGKEKRPPMPPKGTPRVRTAPFFTQSLFRAALPERKVPAHFENRRQGFIWTASSQSTVALAGADYKPGRPAEVALNRSGFDISDLTLQLGLYHLGNNKNRIAYH